MAVNAPYWDTEWPGAGTLAVSLILAYLLAILITVLTIVARA